MLFLGIHISLLQEAVHVIFLMPIKCYASFWDMLKGYAVFFHAHIPETTYKGQGYRSG
jgi:hypothetical protein